MAKVGEGDQRWIVDDMGKVGTNVGRWHWEEKNVFSWCQDRLKELCKDHMIYEGSECTIKMKGISNVSGEANILNRKGKLLTFYELDVKIHWVAQLNDDEKNKVSGKIELPYLSEEHDEDDQYEIKVSLSDNDKGKHFDIKQIVLKKARPNIEAQIGKFIKELRGGANVRDHYETWEEQNIRLKQQKEKVHSNVSVESKNSSNSTTNQTETSVSPAAKLSKISTESISIKDTFRAPPHEIYDCFMNENKVKAYTQSNASIEPKEGGKFSLFNGTIHGEIVKIEEDKLIVQKWRFKDWPADCYSNLEMRFEYENSETTLRIKQTNIPREDIHNVLVKPKVIQGWRENFIKRIKLVFGFGGGIIM